ncbi:MAG: hypothetical protein GQF41_4292 [Candidatus Rifleibacterium amylolyticum]|nr:MAG: hypothetical protein GQF41_4292 [Candidatus Rifleibacterium amylolyticum]
MNGDLLHGRKFVKLLKLRPALCSIQAAIKTFFDTSMPR